MKILGVVHSIDGDKAKIMYSRAKGCGDCSSCSSCDVDMEFITVNLDNNVISKVNDVVELEFKASNMLKATAILYILPLITLVLGIFIGNKLQVDYFEKANEGLSFLSGIIFLVITFVIINIIDRKTVGEELVEIREFKGF